ncbi:MAG: FAD-dependent oxidoreductase [Eubacteriaceae bacterium]|nr:FAD-dependent oxidoreductase [Eubacteriaceae bacterium]
MKHIVIIGGGAAGFNAALAAAKENNKVTVIEAGKLGGLCVNQGCIPTKSYLTLIENNYDSHPEKGIELSVSQLNRVKTETQEMIQRLAYGQSYQFSGRGINLIKGRATIEGAGSVKIYPKNREETPYEMHADGIIAATGSIPKTVTELNKISVYSTGDLFDDSFPDNIKSEKITVIGGGVTGIECGIILAAVGKKITIIEQGDSILGDFDEDISQRMEYILQGIGIAVKTGCTTPEDEAVLLCTGRTPIIPAHGPEVSFDVNERGGIAVDINQETSVEGIYAVGDCTGETMEVSTIPFQVERAVAAISGKGGFEVRDSCIARCVYGPIQGVSVGSREQDIKAAKDEHTVFFAELYMTGAGQTGREKDGFVKVIYEKKTGIVKGMHFLCRNGSMLAPFAQMTINYKHTVDDVRRIPFPHPTVAEILREI